MKKILIWKAAFFSVTEFKFPHFSTSFVAPPPKYCIYCIVHREVIEQHIGKSF